ncbi:DOPA-like domain-containing protein [Chytriomyces sp. MP71]|nr:DOPA-like domain-containing protein [Chytriomyces sp. MP71]
MIEEIKEFHFHLYWISSSKAALADAQALLDLIDAKNGEGYFVAKPLRINNGPVGPHPMSSCEVWVPIEYFGKFYGWVAQVRPQSVSLMIHPLSKHELLDHTERIAFMGPSVPLNVEYLEQSAMAEPPAQYPEFKLGYSADA